MRQNGKNSPLRELYTSVENFKNTESVVERYLYLVRQIAGSIHRNLPAGVDMDSLIQSGIVGLLEAAKKFDPARGIYFSTFAHKHIRGRITDYLRSLDWASRSIRRWGRNIAKTEYRLSQQLMRTPSNEEMAQELDIPLVHYQKLTRKIHEAQVISLEDRTETSYTGVAPDDSETLIDNSPTPELLVEKKYAIEKLLQALPYLTEREQKIISLYYCDDMTLKEIGDIYGLTEGRICQIHQSAISRLQDIFLKEKKETYMEEQNGLNTEELTAENFRAPKEETWFKTGSERELILQAIYKKAEEDENGFRTIKNPARYIRELALAGKKPKHAGSLVQKLKNKGVLCVINPRARGGPCYIFSTPNEKDRFDKKNGFHQKEMQNYTSLEMSDVPMEQAEKTDTTPKETDFLSQSENVTLRERELKLRIQEKILEYMQTMNELIKKLELS
ncbi:MAG: RNA polymerase sigma factor for flagellar operon FliA [Parcubacteria group bacterium Gr01-1014_66]|nr:MAG: RNA polymerase sigma factor for flagellar operon FliA [Parcubacteria group bacterium Gr01-1014_66]